MTIGDFFNEKHIWLILNIILILYGLILFFYGKYSGRKNNILFVIIKII